MEVLSWSTEFEYTLPVVACLVISEGMACADIEIYRKTRVSAVGLMGQVNRVNNLCESNGETDGECRL